MTMVVCPLLVSKGYTHKKLTVRFALRCFSLSKNESAHRLIEKVCVELCSILLQVRNEVVR
jgi:hypothetical protein